MGSASRRAQRAVFVLAALVCCFAALTTAGAATQSGTYVDRVGVNTHLVWVSEADAYATFAHARAGGVTWVREEFPWGVVEPQRGSFAWARTDAMMAAASRAGVDVLGILAYSAPWASSDPSGNRDSKYPPRDVADYARYATAVVRRYGPGGSFWAARPDLPARPLTAVQIWNEPWGHWFWKPNPSPDAYARLARAAAAAIRAASPQVKILIAGDVLQVRTDGAIVDWLENLRAVDPGLNTLVDAYAVHPYPYPRTNGPFVERTDPRWDFRRVTMTRQIDPALPIWITEVGWSTAATSDSVSEETQATYVAGAVRRALDEWGAYVERIFVYSLDRDGSDRTNREQFYGLLRADGSAKPSWSALRSLLATATSMPALPAFTVSITAPASGARVSGPIVWEAVPAGAAVERIDFAVDGAVRWTERVAPYRYNGDTGTFDTGELKAGTHVLSVTAVAADGRVARASVKVDVAKRRTKT